MTEDFAELIPSLERSSGSTFFRNVLGTIGARGVGLVLAFLTSVFTARSLGPDGRGTFAVAITLTTIGIQVANLGLHAGNTYAASREPHRFSSLVANSLVISAALGSVVGLAIWVASLAWPNLVPLPAHLLLVALACIPLGLASLFLQQLLLAIGRIRDFNRIELAGRGLTLLAVGAIAIAGLASPIAFVAVVAAVSIVAIVIALRGMKDRLGGSLRPDAGIARRHFGYGLRAYAAAMVSFLVIRVDLLMVNGYRGSVDAGEYAVAVALADVVYLLPATIGSLLFPRLTTERDDGVRRRETVSVAAIVAVVMAAAVGAAAALAPLVIPTVYGQQFAAAVPAFVLLVPGIALLSIETVFMNYFAAVGMPPIVFLAPALGLVINVSINTWLIPAYGITGASISSTLTYAMMLIVVGIFYVRSRGRHER